MKTKRMNRVLSIVLTLCLVLGMMTAMSIPVSAATDYWTDHTTEVTAQGDVYSIDTAGELAWIAMQVNSGNSFAGKTVKLTADIDLAAYKWVPFGLFGGYDKQNKPFSGTFDGAGHTVDHMALMDDITFDGFGFFTYGLFGFVQNGTIKDLHVHGATDGSFRPLRIGGVVGYSQYATIDGATFPAP